MEHQTHHHGEEEPKHYHPQEDRPGELIYEDEVDEEPGEDQPEEPKHKGKKTEKIEFKFAMSRGAVASLVILLILAGSAFAGWKYGLLDKATKWYSAATVSAKVIEKDTNKPLDGVTMMIDGVIAKSDAGGLLALSGLTSGDATVTVSKEGYIPSTYTTKLYRGSNPLSDIVLEKAPDKLFDLTGTVTDVLNGDVIAKAKVRVGDLDATTDAKGLFALQVKADASNIVVTKEGYSDFTQIIAFTANQTFDAVKAELTPRLSIVFEQEKSGKIDIYQAGADGQNIIAITEGNRSYSSKSPLVSPDSTKLVYLSDKEKTDNSTFKLFYRDSKGNTTKVSDDSNPYHINWLGNDTIVYSYYAQTSPSQTYVISYNTSNKKRTVISKAPSITLNISVNVDNVAVSPSNIYVVWSQSSYSNNSPATDEITTATNDAKGIFIAKNDGSDYKRLSSITSYIDNIYFVANSQDVHYSYYDNTSYVYKSINLASGQESTSTKTILDRDYNRSAGYDGPNDFSGQSTLLTKDGKYYYIDTRNGRTDVFLAGSDGLNEIQITKLGIVKGIHLSADEKYLLIGTNSDNITALYVSGVSTTTPKKVVESYSQNAGFIK